MNSVSGGIDLGLGPGGTTRPPDGPRTQDLRRLETALVSARKVCLNRLPHISENLYHLSSILVRRETHSKNLYQLCKGGPRHRRAALRGPEEGGAFPMDGQKDLLPGQQWPQRSGKKSGKATTSWPCSPIALSTRGAMCRARSNLHGAARGVSPKQIFVIPVRKERCEPIDERLRVIDRADLFPSYEDGLCRILRTLGIDVPPNRTGGTDPAEADDPQHVGKGEGLTSLNVCAEFTGRDRISINFGYGARHLEQMTEKVLEFLEKKIPFRQEGRSDSPDAVVRVEHNGETLVSKPGALLRLGRRRDERSYLLSLAMHREYMHWADNFIRSSPGCQRRFRSKDSICPSGSVKSVHHPLAQVRRSGQDGYSRQHHRCCKSVHNLRDCRRTGAGKQPRFTRSHSMRQKASCGRLRQGSSLRSPGQRRGAGSIRFPENGVGTTGGVRLRRCTGEGTSPRARRRHKRNPQGRKVFGSQGVA